MKTRIDPTQYTAHNHLGKFEGEISGATEYFWEQMLIGDGETIFGSIEYEDESAEEATIFRVNAEEAEAFDLPIGSVFMLREDGQGFVYGSCHMTQGDAEAKFRHWLGLPFES